MNRTRSLVVACLSIGLAIGILAPRLHNLAVGETSAQESSVSPVKATQNRDAYFPGTEDLAPDAHYFAWNGNAVSASRSGGSMFSGRAGER